MNEQRQQRSLLYPISLSHGSRHLIGSYYIAFGHEVLTI